MNVTNRELKEVLDESGRKLVEAEHNLAARKRILTMSNPGAFSSTNADKVREAEHQVRGWRMAAQAVVKYARAASTQDVDAIMAETRRVVGDPDLWSDGKATVADKAAWLDYWDRQGAETVALTNRAADLAARGLRHNIDVMSVIGPLIKSLRD